MKKKRAGGQYAIEKNVPISKPKKQSKYPFNQMDIGDSFLVPCSENAKGAKTSSIWNSFRKHKKDYGPHVKITVRSVSEGIRVWRVNP